MATKKIEIDWNILFFSTLKAFPKIWWRILIVNLLTLVMILFGAAIIVGFGILFFGGFHESINVIENLFMTGYITIQQLVVLVLFSLIVITIMITFGMIGKISSFLIVKDYTKKKARNPNIIYFQESWKYFWRYGLLGLRIFWYIIWPVLLLLFVAGISYGMSVKFLNAEFIPSWLIVLIPMFVGILGFTIYRSLNMVFSNPQLIEKNKTIKKAFDNSLILIKGNWWKIFGILLLTTFIVSMLPSMIFSVLSQYLELPVFNIIYQFYSFVIVAPFMVSFVYFLMLYVSKQKKLK